MKFNIIISKRHRHRSTSSSILICNAIAIVFITSCQRNDISSSSSQEHTNHTITPPHHHTTTPPYNHTAPPHHDTTPPHHNITTPPHHLDSILILYVHMFSIKMVLRIQAEIEKSPFYTFNAILCTLLFMT